MTISGQLPPRLSNTLSRPPPVPCHLMPCHALPCLAPLPHVMTSHVSFLDLISWPLAGSAGFGASRLSISHPLLEGTQKAYQTRIPHCCSWPTHCCSSPACIDHSDRILFGGAVRKPMVPSRSCLSTRLELPNHHPQTHHSPFTTHHSPVHPQGSIHPSKNQDWTLTWTWTWTPPSSHLRF